MLLLELITLPDLDLQLCRLRLPCIQGLANDLVHKVISEDFHHGPINRGFGQREHALKAFIYESDLHRAIRDQNTFDHAGQNSPQTEIFVGNMPRDLPLSPRHLIQIAVNFLDDPGTWSLLRKAHVRQQILYFATQEEQAPPKRYCNEA